MSDGFEDRRYRRVESEISSHPINEERIDNMNFWIVALSMAIGIVLVLAGLYLILVNLDLFALPLIYRQLLVIAIGLIIIIIGVYLLTAQRITRIYPH
jgi:cell division protein FtsW (lipid II flippase)